MTKDKPKITGDPGPRNLPIFNVDTMSPDTRFDEPLYNPPFMADQELAARDRRNKDYQDARTRNGRAR